MEKEEIEGGEIKPSRLWMNEHWKKLEEKKEEKKWQMWSIGWDEKSQRKTESNRKTIVITKKLMW